MEEVMAKYDLSIQEVCLAILVSHGVPTGDAFLVAFPEHGKVASQREAMYARLVSARPNIIAYINALSATADNASARQNQQFNLSTKEGLLASLEQEYSSAVDAKQRADILMKIADLRRMKQEEDTEKNKLIHYYLPLRCEVCPAKKEFENKK